MDAADELERDIAGMRSAQERLVAHMADLDDGTARAPSRLPGWSVGHVLTHIARNGDSFAWRLEGPTTSPPTPASTPRWRPWTRWRARLDLRPRHAAARPPGAAAVLTSVASK